MSGSKNTELTVKYVCRSLAATSLEFRRIDLVAYSTNPITENTSPSPTVITRQPRNSSGVQRTFRSSRYSSANGT